MVDILIVEDDNSTRRLLERILNRVDYIVFKIEEGVKQWNY